MYLGDDILSQTPSATLNSNLKTNAMTNGDYNISGVAGDLKSLFPDLTSWSYKHTQNLTSTNNNNNNSAMNKIMNTSYVLTLPSASPTATSIQTNSNSNTPPPPPSSSSSSCSSSKVVKHYNYNSQYHDSNDNKTSLSTWPHLLTSKTNNNNSILLSTKNHLLTDINSYYLENEPIVPLVPSSLHSISNRAALNLNKTGTVTLLFLN